jgi:hypothetical protein
MRLSAVVCAHLRSQTVLELPPVTAEVVPDAQAVQAADWLAW